MLAGISSDYYLRLEQGRDHHPSAQVLDALARALRLDDVATAHLHALAQPPRRRPPQEPEQAPSSIVQLIALWPNTPAHVIGRHLDVLAANALASALSPIFSPGVNLVRAVFLDPELPKFVRDWEQAQLVVARLRGLVGPDVDDPGLVELVGELSVRSDEFRRLWARHDINLSPSQLQLQPSARGPSRAERREAGNRRRRGAALDRPPCRPRQFFRERTESPGRYRRRRAPQARQATRGLARVADGGPVAPRLKSPLANA